MSAANRKQQIDAAALLYAAQIQAQQQAQPVQQGSNTVAYLFMLALLISGFWPKISPFIPPDINPVPVSVNPFGSVEGLHVLISYSAEQAHSREQDLIINSTRIREAVPFGKFKCLDTETVFLPEEKLWQDAMEKLKPANRPMSIAIGNGSKGYIGDCPATEDATLELINKYK